MQKEENQDKKEENHDKVLKRRNRSVEIANNQSDHEINLLVVRMNTYVNHPFILRHSYNTCIQQATGLM